MNIAQLWEVEDHEDGKIGSYEDMKLGIDFYILSSIINYAY